MQIKKVEEFDALAFTDIQGIVRVIHGCPLTKLKEFAAIRTLLWREIKAESNLSEVTVQSLYYRNSFFAQMCLRALELCGVSPDWVDLNMMSQLLFPFAWKGKTTEGLLVQLNFPSDLENNNNSSNTNTQGNKTATWNELLASLWGATDNLQSAMELADTAPWNGLHATIKARGEQMCEARKKAGGMSKEEEEQEIAKAYQEYLTKKEIQDKQQVGQETQNKATSLDATQERFSSGIDSPFNDPSEWTG